MALYEYKGVSGSGKNEKGVIEADNSKSARMRLKQRGILTTSIRERSGKNPTTKGGKKNYSSGAGIKMKSITLMTRQLATLIKARIPLDEALGALVDQTDENKLKGVLSQVRISVNEGKSLHEACKMFPKVFTPIFISMIRAGEASGNLDLVLNRLAAFAESQQGLRNKVVGAMAYPAFMMIAGSAITIFLFAFAVPKITEVFAGSDMPLPTLTVVMIGISDFMSAHWILAVSAVVGVFFLFQWYTSTASGRAWWDRFSLKLPAFGKLKRMIAVSRFSRTLGTLIGSGVQVMDAIDIVKDVVDNTVIREALISARKSISEGKSIAGPLKESGQFPPILTHMIAVGEKTGELEEMLNVVSDTYDEQVDTAVQSMTRLLEPLMIVVMGGVIALVALSIFMPMLQLNNFMAL